MFYLVRVSGSIEYGYRPDLLDDFPERARELGGSTKGGPAEPLALDDDCLRDVEDDCAFPLDSP